MARIARKPNALFASQQAELDKEYEEDTKKKASGQKGYEGRVPYKDERKPVFSVPDVLEEGMQVRHDTYGYGVIQSVDTEKGRVTVDFDGKVRKFDTKFAFSMGVMRLTN